VFNISNCGPHSPPIWLGDPTLAKAAIITVHAWRIIPFATVIFLAGIASIPNEVHDAAAGRRRHGPAEVLVRDAAAAAPDRDGRAPVRDRVHGHRHDRDLHPDPRRSVHSSHMVTTWAFNVGVESGSLGEGAAISLFLVPVLALVAIGMLVFARKAEVT